jgi:hypothetical protein
MRQDSPVHRSTLPIAAALAVVAGSGCGGGGGGGDHKSAGTSPPPGPTTVAETGHPAFNASLSTDTSTPKTGVPWAFAVRAVDARGRPIPATAIVRVIQGHKVLDTVGWFGFKGTLRRSYKWSSDLEGSSAVLEVKVVGSGGTRAIRHAVKVRSG